MRLLSDLKKSLKINLKIRDENIRIKLIIVSQQNTYVIKRNKNLHVKICFTDNLYIIHFHFLTLLIYTFAYD